MQVKAENLSYTYNEKNKDLCYKALDGINLTIREGEFFAIVGHTGSGKSTFIQHINGLIKTNKGTLKVGEFSLTEKKCDFKSLRSKVGMVFQYPEYQLFAETVKADVGYGLKNFFKDLPQQEVERRIKVAIETVGLNYEEVKDKSPFELSGGQKRRVAIAGVIVTRPEILVLDEPVAGLDPLGKREFLQLLKNMHNDFIKTIILVTHDMNIVSEYCDRVAVFSNGKVDICGSLKEVFIDSENSCEKMQSLGLELPTIALITKMLRKNGINIDSDLTLDDFTNSVKNKFLGEKL